MQSVKKVKVDETEYEMHYLNPFLATDLLTRLMKKIIKPIGGVFNGVVSLAGILDKSLDQVSNSINIAGGFMELANNLDSEVVVMLRELLAPVRLGTGMEFQAEVQFEGRIMHMFKVAYASFEFNYADFLDAKSGALAVIRRALNQVKQMSTGSSGESLSQGLPHSLKSTTGGR
jgi:hypothetical protein